MPIMSLRSGVRPVVRPAARAGLGIVAGLLLGCLLGLGLAMAWAAGPASAHANLVGTDPAEGTIVSAAPDQVVLEFSEPVRLLPDRLVVVAPDGEPVRLGPPRADGADVVVPLAEDRGRGTYLVSYRVISLDSHPVGGTASFSVEVESAVPELPAGQAGGIGDPVVGAAVSINKYLGYAGLVMLVGPAIMLGRLWPSRLSRRGATRLVWAGAGAVAVSAGLGLWLQAPYRTGGGLFGASGSDLQEVVASSFGTAHLVRLAVLVSAAVLLRPLLAGRATRTDGILLIGLALIGLGTWPVAGHPVASPLPALSVVAGTAHVAGMAFWLGGLLVLVGFLLRLADQRELSVILPEWSRWAATAVVVLLFAGLVLAVVEIGPPEALVTTRYGQLLLVKVGLVALVVAVAGYSRRLVRDRSAPLRPGAMRLAVTAEAVILAGVLAVASVLVQTTPGRTEVAAGNLASTVDGTFATTLDSRLYSVQVLVDPAERGSNLIHLTVYTLDGDPLPAQEWQVTIAPPAGDLEPIEVQVLDLTDNHVIGETRLPVAGEWELEVTIRVSEIDQATVRVTVPIS